LAAAKTPSLTSLCLTQSVHDVDCQWDLTNTLHLTSPTYTYINRNNVKG